MARYGLDYYSSQALPLSYYGSDNPLNYSAQPITALVSGYNKITLTWNTPVGDWVDLRIIRSPYGYPVNVTDGQLVFEATRLADPTVYVDEIPLTKTKVYFYSFFVFDKVQLVWILAGRASGVSVNHYANSLNLYDLIPQIYKLTTPYAATDYTENEQLRSFLNLFDFQFDYARALTELITDRYNFENATAQTIPLLLNQFGIRYEPEIGFQQARILVRDSVQLTKEKGSRQGLREYIKDFTGWACPSPIAGTPNPAVEGIQVGHNLMLDYNDSSFEESIGRWVSDDASASLKQLPVVNATAYSVTSNTLRIIIGTHGYRVADKIVTSRFKVPKFNFNSATAITAVGDNYIEVSVTSPDIAQVSAYNEDLQTYPTVSPYPVPYAEPNTLLLYPNKQKGILSIANTSASSGNISIACGTAAPVTRGIPVTGGQTYTFSSYIAASVTSRSVTAGIDWYNRFGVYISSNAGSSLSNSVGVFDKRVKVSASAPANAYYAVPKLTVASVANSSSNERHYFDACQFEKAASTTDFDEARQLHITMKANRINELTNPSFFDINNLAPWSFTNATVAATDEVSEPIATAYSIAGYQRINSTVTMSLTTVHPFKTNDTVYIIGVGSPYGGLQTITGVSDLTINFSVAGNQTIPFTSAAGTVTRSGHAVEVTSSSNGDVTISSATTNADYMDIYYPSTTYTFSIYAQGGIGSSFWLRPDILWYDSSKNLISTETGISTNITSNVEWTRISVSGIAPATTAYASVNFVWESSAAGDSIEVDDALFENSPFVLPYFDGSQGPGPVPELFWEGQVPNAARSHYYKNRVAVADRLVNGILNEWLVSGSTYALYLAQPKT